MIDVETKGAAFKLLTDLENALSGEKIKPKFKKMWIEDAHCLIKICRLILSDQENKALKHIYSLDSYVMRILPSRVYNKLFGE